VAPKETLVQFGPALPGPAFNAPPPSAHPTPPHPTGPTPRHMAPLTALRCAVVAAAVAALAGLPCGVRAAAVVYSGCSGAENLQCVRVQDNAVVVFYLAARTSHREYFESTLQLVNFRMEDLSRPDVRLWERCRIVGNITNPLYNETLLECKATVG
jgi:hypothetical protein